MEYNLAKVGVVSSNLIARSIFSRIWHRRPLAAVVLVLEGALSRERAPPPSRAWAGQARLGWEEGQGVARSGARALPRGGGGVQAGVFKSRSRPRVMGGLHKICLGQRRGCALIAAVRLAGHDQPLVVRGLRLGQIDEGVDPRQNQNREEDENGSQDDLEG